jgi:hypothetical protein
MDHKFFLRLLLDGVLHRNIFKVEHVVFSGSLPDRFISAVGAIFVPLVNFQVEILQELVFEDLLFDHDQETLSVDGAY